MDNDDINAKDKIALSNNLRFPVLNTTINEKFPGLELHFYETDSGNWTYPIDFKFGEIIYINKKQFVMSCEMLVSLKDKKKGQIEYNFETQKFYDVRFNKAIRRIYDLRVDKHFLEETNKFLTYMTSYVYSMEDFENIVDTKGPTLSKKR